MKFSHLHNHTMFSLLDGASDISRLYKKAAGDGMPALAITDHGNMFGAFQFVAEAYKHKNADGTLKVKPIVGCEFYVVTDRTRNKFSREEKDIRYHQVLLAKNETGYKNLIKMCSLGYTEGMYGKYPRIDKSLIEKYHEGLIATTCCLAAEVPRAIMKKSREEAEEVFLRTFDGERAILSGDEVLLFHLPANQVQRQSIEHRHRAVAVGGDTHQCGDVTGNLGARLRLKDCGHPALGRLALDVIGHLS